MKQRKVFAVNKDNYKQGVRETGELVIFFKDKESVWIQYDGGVVIAHRWDDKERGRYASAWRPFQHKLKNALLQNIYDVIKYANIYDIGFIYTERAMPEIPKQIKRY